MKFKDEEMKNLKNITRDLAGKLEQVKPKEEELKAIIQEKHGLL